MTRQIEFSSAVLFELRDVAVAAAQAAAKVILKYRHTPLDVRQKGEGSKAATVVTEVDILSQAAVVAVLQESIEKFNLALLCEENPDDGSRLHKRAFWCVDPLDGTLPFIERETGYAVSIGLISLEGAALVGVILDPENNRLYTGVAGEGAFCNEKRLFPGHLHGKHNSKSREKVLTCIVDRSSLESVEMVEMKAMLEESAELLGFRGVDIFNYGGAAMNAMESLHRAPACYVKFPRRANSGGSLWDYGASACIYREAGAQVTDVWGNPLDLNRPDSTFMNHRGFIYATDERISTVVWRAASKYLMK